ncbi:hypothetical protein [Chitinophaga sp. CF418]|uniref:hypothetical protein n=1 Tax=Chitinophaga sp. CF418 TaxID=1855287 RepID=UPI000918CC9E|nr:hypothetical protein [Chitinophaga sp. CF418]SHN45516.1 hypothetical protein SAMN05216311_12086 [Chitinophaga sp. CF418]
MNKAKKILVFILASAAISAAYAMRARDFFGYIGLGGGLYSAVYVPFDCPEVGWGCLYTINSNTYQVYTLSGIRMNPVKP